MRSWRANKYRVLIFCGTQARADKLREVFDEEGIGSSAPPASLELLKGVAVSAEELESGLILHEQKLVVIGTGELYTKSAVKKRIRRKRKPSVGQRLYWLAVGCAGAAGIIGGYILLCILSTSWIGTLIGMIGLMAIYFRAK